VAIQPNRIPNSGYHEVACTFCRGTGKDPFGVLSPLSRCEICQGEGTILVRAPFVHCGECRGTAVQPHKRLTCSACAGRGVHSVAKKNQACPNCKGSGIAPGSGSALACCTCNGSGRIALDISPA
jgi:DnaJ-class molecular chaperone